LFSGPIVFDQPEDDLDNDFITNQLIDLFKEIKIYRQLIIVSHNANLVVNADSEQVIIAKNTKEKLSYESGSLENEKINKQICRILEGGERAFEKRRDKYRYVK
jgi:predicted ATPase